MSGSPAAGERVLLGIGGNMGDRVGELRAGLAALAGHPAIEVVAVSGLWESEYVGDGRQDAYLNGCVEIRTRLEPPELLAAVKGIERRRGRRPDGHLRPRPLDLDILVHGERVVAAADLRIPHPELRRRAFVLEPLGELAADLELPDSGETVAGIRAKIRAVSGPGLRPWPGPGLRDDPAED